jgi:hypothetical protein
LKKPPRRRGARPSVYWGIMHLEDERPQILFADEQPARAVARAAARDREQLLLMRVYVDLVMAKQVAAYPLAIDDN